MAYFVLIHGACHGAWCWGRLVPALEALGHHAVAIDLPGSGQDTTPASEVTLASYAAAAARCLEAQPEPAFLVGHSLGGATITQTGENVPERIAKLVYLAAFLPQDGDSAFDMTSRVNPGGARLPMTLNVERTALVLDRSNVADIFYGLCSPEDAAWAASLLTPQPLQPGSTPVRRSAARFGALPRAYIECTEDRAIPIAVQRAMAAAEPGIEILSLPADHSPFLSQPAALAACLDRLVDV